MHFWKSSNSPTSSSSSPKSSPPSPLSKQKRVLRDISHLWSRREQSREPQPPQQPRLTRQRKLRHISEFDIRPSVSASSTPLSRSPSRWGPSSARSLSVVSHPLPLPDDAFLRRGESALSYSSSNSGLFPLPSPKEAEVNGVDVGTGDGPLSSSPTAQSRLSYPNFHKGAEHVDTSTGSMLDQGKHAFQDSSAVENIRSNFKVNFPAKSAPTSGFSSPVLSPRRLSTGDFSPSAYMSYQGQLPSWSDPVFPASDMIFDAYASPEKFLASPGRSPLHSPRTSSPGPKSPSRAASPKHPKMAPENNAVWHDNNVAFAGHPLPLPPGAAVPSQTTLVHQGTAKSDVSPMISQWQKTKLIGSGTFGNVYVAINRETGASCAMKEVNIIPDDLKSIESVKQLEQEIKVLSKLKHPNIVQYFGSEIVEDRFYIYLEYVHPGSINKYIREHCGAMTESVVRNFTRHIVSGLAYLHSTKTIHRDIKGANLLVDASGVVKLADFGMAKHLTGQGALSVVGSPYWMAPEVLQANMMQKENGYDLAVDIWSLGCTIIEMFTGKPPWSEFEGAAAMFKVLRNESPPTPETLSADGKSFLQCCFQKNPADRPSASQLLEHPFLRNSHHQEIHSCIQAISDMKLTDMAKTPRERTGSVQKLQGTQVSKGKQLINGEAGNSHPESSESAAPRRHSPRSTLEAISSLFPSRSDHITYGSSHRSNALHGTHLREQLSSHI